MRAIGAERPEKEQNCGAATPTHGEKVGRGNRASAQKARDESKRLSSGEATARPAFKASKAARTRNAGSIAAVEAREKRRASNPPARSTRIAVPSSADRAENRSSIDLNASAQTSIAAIYPGKTAAAGNFCAMAAATINAIGSTIEQQNSIDGRRARATRRAPRLDVRPITTL